MGYRSDVVIGISKELYTKCVLLNNIPSSLKNEDTLNNDLGYYWHIRGWKWYQGYDDVVEIERWFEWCIAHDESLCSGESKFDPPTNFGALRSGEEACDFEEWGDPGEFEIYRISGIDSPFE